MAEAAQGLPFKLQPLTMVGYPVDHASIVDLSPPAACDVAGVRFKDLACAWELIAHEGGTPPSWALADRLMGRGVGGIIVPSFAAGAPPAGVNIVFWEWRHEPPLQVRAIDDEERLPMDGASWHCNEADK